MHRDGIKAALAGRDDVLLEPVLRLLVKHVSDPRFGELASDIAAIVIGKRALERPSTTYVDQRSRDVHASLGAVSFDRLVVPSASQESGRRVEVSEGVGAVTWKP